ncbi:MAG: hypothetical protein Q9163_001282 [Psora crenata]
MAEVSQATNSSTEETLIYLKVVSPSLAPLTLPSLSVSTTVSQLKAIICELAPTHPPVAHQRLIYRGHPLVRGDQTLKSVFSQQTINENDPITIHLVMPPSPPSPTSLGSSAQPHTRLPSTTNVHPSQGVENMPQSNQSGPRQSQMPNARPYLLATTVNYGQPATPQVQLPPHLQHTLNQFQVIQQQLAAQLASLHNHPIMQSLAAYQNAQLRHPPMFPLAGPQPRGQLTFPQQQQQPQQDNTHGAPLGQSPVQQQEANRQALPHSNGHQRANIGHFHGPASTNAVVREHIGPNGQRWSTVTHFGTMHIVNPTQGHQHQGVVAQGETAFQRSATANSHGAPILQETSGPTVQEGPQAFSEHPNRAAQNRASTPNPTTTDSSTDSAIMLRAAQEIAISQRELRGIDSSAVYILSSPRGPRALLVSPHGNYTAAWPFANPATSAHFGQPGILVPYPTSLVPNLGLHHVNVAPQAVQPGQYQATNPQQNQNAMQAARLQPRAPGPLNHAAVAGVNQQQQHVQQARDLARVIIPLGGHLWLFIRLFGFVYFFTHGASWSRTLFLLAIATLVFIGQTGVFQPLLQGLWEPIRRHAVNLVPLANNEQPHNGNPNAAQGNENAAGMRGRPREPTPQEAAQRLLEQQNDSVVRQGLRRIERAVALFVASLVPGVGERHIAAREAAEALRLETREREERLRREEEEVRQQQAGTSVVGSEGTDAEADVSSREAAAATQGPADTTPPPLIQV